MSFLLRFGLGFYGVVYGLCKLAPTKKKWVFLSRQAERPSIDFVLLEKELRRQHPDYTAVVLCKKLERRPLAALGYCGHMFRQAWHLATARVAILDSYSILASCMHHKEELLIVQLGHSLGSMKKFGHSVLDQEEGSSSRLAQLLHMHEQYDYMLVSSEACRPYLAAGANMPPERMVNLPLPRVEALKDEERAERMRERILARYPALGEGKRVLLYCPTFRKEEAARAVFHEQLQQLIAKVDRDKYVLVVKLHPQDRGSAPSGDGVIVDGEFSTLDMMYVADAVISDYSCAVFEGGIRHLPLYFFAFDFGHYTSARGIYMDYEKEIPSPLCRTVEELFAAIEAPVDGRRQQAFMDKYVQPDSREESATLVRFIFEHQKERGGGNAARPERDETA